MIKEQFKCAEIVTTEIWQLFAASAYEFETRSN